MNNCRTKVSRPYKMECLRSDMHFMRAPELSIICILFFNMFLMYFLRSKSTKKPMGSMPLEPPSGDQSPEPLARVLNRLIIIHVHVPKKLRIAEKNRRVKLQNQSALPLKFAISRGIRSDEFYHFPQQFLSKFFLTAVVRLNQTVHKSIIRRT